MSLVGNGVTMKREILSRIKKSRARNKKNAGHATKKTKGNGKENFTSRLLIYVFFEHYKLKKTY